MWPNLSLIQAIMHLIWVCKPHHPTFGQTLAVHIYHYHCTRQQVLQTLVFSSIVYTHVLLCALLTNHPPDVWRNVRPADSKVLTVWRMQQRTIVYHCWALVATSTDYHRHHQMFTSGDLHTCLPSGVAYTVREVHAVRVCVCVCVCVREPPTHPFCELILYLPTLVATTTRGTCCLVYVYYYHNNVVLPKYKRAMRLILYARYDIQGEPTAGSTSSDGWTRRKRSSAGKQSRGNRTMR